MKGAMNEQKKQFPAIGNVAPGAYSRHAVPFEMRRLKTPRGTRNCSSKKKKMYEKMTVSHGVELETGTLDLAHPFSQLRCI